MNCTISTFITQKASRSGQGNQRRIKIRYFERKLYLNVEFKSVDVIVTLYQYDYSYVVLTWVVITKYHTLGDLNNRDLFLTV